MVLLLSTLPPPPPPPLPTQAAGSDSRDQIDMAARQLATQIEPVAVQAGDALLGAANTLQQGATQQAKELAGRVEEAGQAMGECGKCKGCVARACAVGLLMQAA